MTKLKYHDGTGWKQVANEDDLVALKEDYTQYQDIRLANIWKNGDFSQGLTSWNNFNSRLTVDITDGIATLTANESGARLEQAAPMGINYYISIEMKTSFSGCGIGDSNKLVKAHSGNGEWETLYLQRKNTTNSSSIKVENGATAQVRNLNVLKTDTLIKLENSEIKSLLDSLGGYVNGTIIPTQIELSKWYSSWNLETLNKLTEVENQLVGLFIEENAVWGVI